MLSYYAFPSLALVTALCCFGYQSISSYSDPKSSQQCSGLSALITIVWLLLLIILGASTDPTSFDFRGYLGPGCINRRPNDWCIILRAAALISGLPRPLIPSRSCLAAVQAMSTEPSCPYICSRWSWRWSYM